MPRIQARSPACTGCRMCEMACSVAKTGKFSSRSSRVWIETDGRIGKDLPHVCRQNVKACRAPGSPLPRCMAACPLLREPDPPISWDETSGVVQLRPRRSCPECLACAEACRFGAIRIDPAEGRLVKCDLCGGDPECVKVCVTEAIRHERGQDHA